MNRIGMKTIAKEAGVHHSTVSLAMRNDERIPKATRQRIQAIAAKLDYQPNYFARGLKGKRTNSIGILISRLRDPYVVDLLDAQEKFLREQKYLPLLAVVDGDPDDEIKVMENLAARGIDGLAFNYTPRNPETLRLVQKLVHKGKPVSILGQTDRLSGVDQVDVDMQTSSCQMTRHLLELGHRAICLIVMAPDDARELGYRQAFQQAGVQVDDSLIIRGDDAHAAVDSLIANILAHHPLPTAIFAFNDDLAIEIMTRLIRSGLSVPGEVSIVGVNDDWYSASVLVPLTTIRLSPRACGETLVRMIVQRMGEETLQARREVFRGELVVRQSTAPPPVHPPSIERMTFAAPDRAAL